MQHLTLEIHFFFSVFICLFILFSQVILEGKVSKVAKISVTKGKSLLFHVQKNTAISKSEISVNFVSCDMMHFGT